MGSLSSFLDGWRRVGSAPALLAGVFVMTFLLAVPLAITVRDLIATQLGSSMAADAVADGVSYDWWQEFTAQTSGLGATFTPSVIGFAAVLDNVSGLADGRAPSWPIRGALAIYLAGWLFLSGGIIDRYARQRPTRAHAFFSACGVYFFRFLRLGIITGLTYWFLFAYVHRWLFNGLYADVNTGLASERTAIIWRFGLYAVFALLLLAVNLLFDYAKIRAVVEDRRSMLGALRAGIGFVVRHPGSVLGLYLLDGAVFLIVLAVWAAVAPGTGGAGLSMWIGFLVGQIYLAVRLAIKLQFIASQTALFQRSLAHASYVAAPLPQWPESPAVEAIS
jgi:hypothetical protein